MITKEAERVSQSLGTRIMISPPQPLLAWVAKNTNLEIVSQHVDANQIGPSTGFTIPEMVKESGAIGSLINHSEHPIDIIYITEIIKKMRSLKLVSVVCAKNFDELTMIAKLEPDYIAIEPPELIGTKRSISTEKPSLISESFQYLDSNRIKSKLICGAGINTPEDVRIALDLGSDGILAASSIVKSDKWYEKIYELASQFKDSK
jgi:triosephosphate isomerase